MNQKIATLFDSVDGELIETFEQGTLEVIQKKKKVRAEKLEQKETDTTEQKEEIEQISDNETKTKKPSKKKAKEPKEIDNSPQAEAIRLKASEARDYIGNVINQNKIEKIEDILLFQIHPSVAVRRKLATEIHKLANKKYLETLKEWKEKESDGEVILGLESSIDKLEREFGDLDKSVKVYTVSEAIMLAKKLLGDREYSIEGELVEVKVYPTMYYFGLKDKEENRINCAVYAGSVKYLSFPLNEGLTIKSTGKFILDKTSRLSFYIQKIELTGEGILKQNLEKLKQNLEKEGLFDESRKRELKKIPKNILLICSPNSAAIDDFVKVISHRRSGLNIYHLPIKTQGVGAEMNILNALENANEICNQYPIDTIVLTRGGGSTDDLMVFNSEKIARKLYSLISPCIVAIGHEKDWSISELVADKRASTPSNAAELVSMSNNEIMGLAGGYLVNIKNKIQAKYKDL